MFDLRRHAARRRVVHGFTLVELMVTIGVIAVLIGILAPALRGAIRASRDVRCLANQRQIAVGWISYTNDHKKFPSGEPEYVVTERADGTQDRWLKGESVELMRDWGGVDWIIEVEGEIRERVRPVNPYIGAESEILKARAEIFRCPNDDGLRIDFGGWQGMHIVDGVEYNWGNSDLPSSSRPDLISKSRAEDAGESVFSVVGTSYRANDWIWAPVGNPTGMHNGAGAFQATTGGNRPIDAAEPANFVLTGDWDSMVTARLRRNQRISWEFGWWHGSEVSNLSFLDGSARRTQLVPGTAATNSYTFYLDRRMQPKNSQLTAYSRF